MLSINALDRGRGPRRWVLNAAGAALHGISAVAELPARWIGSATIAAGEADGGRLVLREGLPLFEAAGDPERLGRAAGAVLAHPTRRLLRAMGLFPALIPARLSGRAAELAAAVAPEHRAEAAALARAAGVDEDALLRANVVVDCCCSALVAGADAASGRPLRLARNMDFFPAGLLAGATVVSLLRPAGRHAFASIGWPGYNGVISGINERGLATCILLNYEAKGRRAGTPIAYRAREVLERAGTVDETAALFRAAPVASSHYLLLADAAGAAVVWQHGGAANRHDLRDGWLACSNGRRDPSTALAEDDRGRCLRALAAGRAGPDADWLRRATTASYLRGINAQAMLFTPAERLLQVAVGTAARPAIAADWIEVGLASAFAGGALADCPVRRLPPPERLPHYTGSDLAAAR